MDHKPSQLSGGQQQRVACARALAGRPDIVFADEPTGNLDSVAGAEVLGFLRRSVSEFGQTVVMVTHDPNAAGYADRVLFLADGRIVDEMLEPTADRVLERMKHFDAHRDRLEGLTAMLKATLKGLLAHKLRLGMSAFAIILGVAFVAGTFVFTDTLNRSFTDLFRQTAPDVTVRPVDTAVRQRRFHRVRMLGPCRPICSPGSPAGPGWPGRRQCHRPEHLHRRPRRQGDR